MSKNISNLSGRIGLKKNLFQKISDSTLKNNNSESITEIAKEYNITGKVYVSFIVDKQGKVTNVKIVRGVDKTIPERPIT